MPDLQLNEKRLSQLDGNIKQMVSSGASEDDVMKYATDFKNQFGVKKKDGGIVSSPIPLKLPSEDFKQGQKFAETAFTIPTAAVEREKGSKIRVTPKLFGQPGTVDVDIIEEGEDVGYKNIAQRFANDLIISGSDIAAGISEMMRDMGAKQAKGIAKITGSKQAKEFAEKKSQLLYTPEGELTEYAQKATWSTDPEAKTILGLNGLGEQTREMQESYQLPDNGLGKTITALSSFAPDILATALLPEARAAQGASALAKLGSGLFNNFTKYLIVKDPLVAYKESKKAGATAEEAVKEVPGAALKGAVTGVTLAATGMASSLATKGIMNSATKYLVGAASSSAPSSMLKKAAEIGLTGKGGFVTKEGINAITDVIGYGLLYPTGASLIEKGELPSEDEITTGIGTALAFRIKGAFEGGIKFGELNKLVEDIQSAKQGTAFINFMRATPESIQKVYNGPETANELQLQAMEAAQRARKATDLEEKQKAVIQASVLSKAANVKQMADYVVNNKNDFKELSESTLPDEFKQAFLEKANLVNKSVNPVEIEKTNIGNRIKQASDFITQKEAELNSTQDPVAKAEIQVKLEQTNKLLKQQEQALRDLIFEQKKPTDLDLNDINSIKENKKLDNQDIDLQISKLDKNDPDYNEKIESLSKKKEEQNDYYDSVLKAAKETEDVDISVITPDEIAEIENIEIKRPEEEKKEVKPTEVKEEVKPIEENKLKQYNRKGTITPDVINLKYDDNGKEVGGMTLGKYKNYLTLDHIYFSPEYRGTGLSKYAYKDALEIAKNEGYEGLMVGGQLTTEYKTKETYKNFATKELDIKNEKGNPYILLTDWIGKENIEETPEIRLMSPEKVQTTLYHGTNDLLQGDIKISREGIKMSPERLASGSSKEGWGFYTTPNVEQSEVIARELNPNMKDFPAGLTNEPAVKYSSFGGISPDKGFIYEIKLDPSAKVAYDNGLVKDFKNIKKQEFEKLRSLGIDAIYSSGEYVILNPSKIISNKIVLKNTGKKLVNVIPMGERGKLEMNKFKAVTPENLNSYLESILGKGYKKGDILTTGDKKGMTIYYNPKTDEFAAVQTGVRPNWEKVEEVKPTEIKVEPKKISIENKEYTTKTGRQKVTYENGQLVVRDIKTGKEVSAATRKKAIDEYVDAFDFEKGKTAEENITELPEGLNPEEGNLFIIENSENPLELASIYFFEEPFGKAETIDEMIGEFGLGKITQDSFNNFGDRNKVTGGMARTYFKKDGLPLDVAAKEMSDYYETEITPEDLADFIIKYPSGSQSALRQFETRTANEAANRFKELTGLDIDRKMAEKILNDKKNNLTDIEQELLNANYESEQQFQDAYWEAYKTIDKGAEISSVSEIEPTESTQEKITPKKPIKEAKVTEDEAININQVSNELMRQELEMAEYEKIKISDKEAYEKAKDKLLSGYNVESLLKDIESGKKKVIDDVDSILLGITNGTLAKEINKNPKNIDELVDLRKRVIDALDITGSSLGRALRSRQLAIKPMDTLSDFILDAQDAAGVDVLTPAQKEEAFKDYEKYKKASEDSERKILELEELNRQLLAEKEFNLIKKSVVKSKQKKDYVKEREQVFNSIKDKLKKARTGESGLMAVPIPYAAELIAISPEISKLAKLYIEEGVEKLSDVVSKIHENLKNDIDGVTEKDIRNVIAGKYNKPRPAKSDLDKKKALLKREAELLNKIEEVLAGEPKEEKKIIQKNQRIKELQDELKAAQQQMGYDEVTKIQQAEKRAETNIAEIEKKLEENDLSIKRAEKISSPRLEELREKQNELRNELKKRRLEDAGVIVNKENELKRLKSATQRNETESKKIEKQIEEKDFEDKIKAPSFLENEELQKKYPKEYKEFLNSMVKKRDIKFEYEIKKAEERMARMTPSEKRAKIAKEAFNTVKALKSSIDNSFVGVQGGLAFMANPLQGAKAFIESYKDMFNEARFKRGLVEIYENKDLMDLINKSGLEILNPQELTEKFREESMGGTNLLEKSLGEIKGVKIIPAKLLTAPFERAYTSMGNNLRLNIFLKRIAQLEAEGITYENNPKEIKAAARAVNELTGRGKLAKGLETASEKLSWLIWSPKLLASTVNLLGLNDLGNAVLLRKGYYGNLPPKARKFALTQLASGIGMGVSIMAAIALLDDDKEVDADPRSVTFGQVKDKITGDAFNIYGRFTSVVRYVTLMVLGVKEIRGELKTVDTGKETFKFFRGKFNPVAGTASDALITRKTYQGKPYELSDLPKDLLAPLSVQDISKFLEQDGTISLLTKGFATFNGLKVMNEKDFIPQTQQKLYEKGMTSDYLDRLSIVDRRTKKPLTKEEFVKFSDMRDAILKEDLTRLYEDGVPVIGERKLKPYNKATVTEIDKALDWLKSKATRETKEKLFGAEKSTMKSEIDEAYYELMKEKF